MGRLSMKVRFARIEDCAEIANISIHAWKNAYKGIISDHYLDSLNTNDKKNKFEERIKNNEKLIVLEDDNIIKGFCLYGKTSDPNNLECGEIYALYLKPNCINKGYGSVLFNKAIELLKDDIKNKVIIWCLEKNELGKNFYLKKGCRLDYKKNVLIGTEEYVEEKYIYIIK